MIRVIDSAADFKQIVGNDEFIVTHRKANGQWRRAKGKVNVQRNPATGALMVKRVMDDDLRGYQNDIGLVKYFDIDKSWYRSFYVVNITKLIVREEVYVFMDCDDN